MPPPDHDGNPFRGSSDLGFQPKMAPAAFSIPLGVNIAKSLTGTDKKTKRVFDSTDIALDDFSDLPLQADADDPTAGKTRYAFPEKCGEEAPAVTTAADHGHHHPTLGSESPAKHPKYPVADRWGKRVQQSPEAAPAATGADTVELSASVQGRPYVVQPAGKGKSVSKERPSRTDMVLPSGPLPSDEELLTKSLERATGKKVVKISKDNGAPRAGKRGVEAGGVVGVRSVEGRGLRSWFQDKFDTIEDSSADEKRKKKNKEVSAMESVGMGGKGLQKRMPGNVDDSQLQDVVRQINEYIVGTHGSLQKLEKQSESIEQLTETVRKMQDEEMREKFKEELKGEMREEEKQKQEEAAKFEKIMKDPLKKLKDSKEDSKEDKSVVLRDLTLAKRELDKDEDDEDTVTGGTRTLVTEPFSKTHNDVDIGIAHFQLPDHMGGRCGPSGAWRDACPEVYFRTLADTNTGSGVVVALWVLIIGGFLAMILAMAMCLYDYISNRKSRSETARRTRPMEELEPADKV